MNPIRICSAFWTASSAVATDTTDLAPAVQNMVDTVGEEVKQTSGILNKIFQPILDKLPSLIFAILFLLIGFFLVKQIMRILKHSTVPTWTASCPVSFVPLPRSYCMCC